MGIDKKDKKKKGSKKRKVEEVEETVKAVVEENPKKKKKTKADKADKKSSKSDKSKKKEKKSQKQESEDGTSEKKKKKKKSEASDDDDKKEKKKKSKKEKKSKKAKKEQDGGADDKEEQVEDEAETEEKEQEATPAPSNVDVAGVNPEGITKCFIGNLAYDVTDDQAKEFFKDCGEIEELFWCLDKETQRFYGTGFVTFTTAEGAVKAVAKSGQSLLGRDIKVEFAKPRAGGNTPKKGRKTELSAKPEGCVTVFLGNLSYDIDDDKTREFFGSCGDINKIRWLTDRETGDFKGCGFVEFYEEKAVDEAVKLNGQDLMGRAIRIDYATPSKPKTY